MINMKKKTKNNKIWKIENESNLQLIWNVFGMLGIVNSPQIKISGVYAIDDEYELCLENDEIDFMFTFHLENKKDLIAVNNLLCLWCNNGINCTKDCTGKSIFDLNDIDVEIQPE